LIKNKAEKQSMKKLFIILSITLITNIWAGPETFDHLSQYKQSQVKEKGPSEEIVYSGDNNKEAHAVYSYNDKNQLIKASYFLNDKFDGYTEYIYSKENLVEEKLFNNKKNLIEIIKYEYDKKNRIKSYKVSQELNKNTNVIEWTFQYNNDKLISGSRSIDKEITETFVNQNEKDSTNIIQDIFTAEGEKMAFFRYVYQDNILVKKIRNENTGIKRVDYEYDDKNRIIKIFFYEVKSEKERLIKTHVLRYTSAIKTSLNKG